MSQTTSMLDTNYWQVVKKPFFSIASIVLTFVGLGLLSMGTSIWYLMFWSPVADPVATMRDVLAHAWDITLWQGHTSHSSALAVYVSDFSYWAFFKLTWIHQAVERFSQDAPTNTVDMIFRNFIIVPNKQGLSVAMLAAQLFGVRLALIFASVPLLIAAYLVGFVDGLVERYIRRVSAGRESSSLYHRAKFFQLSGGVLMLMAFVCIPIPVDPRWFLIPSAVLLGLLARLQWKYYKKYL